MPPSTMPAESPCLCAGEGGGPGEFVLSNAMQSACGCIVSKGCCRQRFLNAAVLSHVRSLPVHARGSVKRKAMQRALTPGSVSQGVIGIMRDCKESTSLLPALR